MSVTLANGGPRDQRPFSRLEARENLLGATAELSLGYPGLRGPGTISSASRAGWWAYQLEADKLILSLTA